MGCCGKISRVARGIGYMATGMRQDLRDKRIEQCRACEELRAGLSCAACGCLVEAKTRVPEEECPKGKWKSEPVI